MYPRVFRWLAPAALLVGASAGLAAAAPEPGARLSPADQSVEAALQVLAHQRVAIPRLFGPAQATAQAMLHGGRFYLAGDRTWVAEGCNRASGTLAASPLTDAAAARPGDVVWLGVFGPPEAATAALADRLERQRCAVIYFGPTAPPAAKTAARWVDDLTPAGADRELALLGNIVSLWAATGELASATARAGRTLVFLQSHVIWGSLAREALYRDSVWHADYPVLAPVPAGTLARAYVEALAQLVLRLRARELPQIQEIGLELAARRQAGHPAVFLADGGHIMSAVLAAGGSLYRYEAGPVGARPRQADDLVVFFGYVGVPLDLWHGLRVAGAHAVWVVTPLPEAIDYRAFGDRVVDQGWRIGDGAIAAAGYDIRLLPPSAVAELVIYRALLAAAGP